MIAMSRLDMPLDANILYNGATQGQQAFVYSLHAFATDDVPV